MTDLWRWIGRFFIFLILTLIFIMLLNITLKAVAGIGLGQMGGVIATLVPAFLTGMQFAKAEGRGFTVKEAAKISTFVVSFQLVIGLGIVIVSGMLPLDGGAYATIGLVMAGLFVVYTGVAMLFLYLGGKDGVKR